MIIVAVLFPLPLYDHCRSNVLLMPLGAPLVFVIYVSRVVVGINRDPRLGDRAVSETMKQQNAVIGSWTYGRKRVRGVIALTQPLRDYWHDSAAIYNHSAAL